MYHYLLGCHSSEAAVVACKYRLSHILQGKINNLLE